MANGASLQAAIPLASTRLPLLLDVKEAAKELRTSPAMIYRLIKAGILPSLKLGRIKIPYKAMAEMIDRHLGQDITSPENIRALNDADFSE